MRINALLPAIAITLAAGLGPANADHIVACGQTINGGSHVLQSDLNCPNGSGGITLQNGAELDLDRHTVTCDDIKNCIVLEGGSEVHGGTVIAGRPGILLKSGSSNHVHDMHVIGAFTAGIQAVAPSNNGLIIDNIVTDSNSHGIRIEKYSDGNEVAGNTVKYSGVGSAILILSDDNLMSGNTLNKTEGDGMVVTGFRNDVIGNTLNNNDPNGIVATGDSQTNLFDNVANNNSRFGILIDSKANVVLKRNVTMHNGGFGIINFGTADCPVSGPDRNRSKNNGEEDFFNCP